MRGAGGATIGARSVPLGARVGMPGRAYSFGETERGSCRQSLCRTQNAVVDFRDVRPREGRLPSVLQAARAEGVKPKPACPESGVKVGRAIKGVAEGELKLRALPKRGHYSSDV